MDFPSKPISPLCISTLQRYSGAVSGVDLSTPTLGAGNWPAANQAIYTPVSIPYYFPVARVFWANGSAVTGNKDFGIYTLDGARIFSTGSTAEAGASATQFVTPTVPFILPPGMYYFALACDIATNHGYGLTAGVTTNEGRLSGMLQQATALPLPASATFAQWASSLVPLCGVSRK